MARYLLLGILTGSAYALLAVAFVLVYKGTRVFNLAQGEIGGIGLYVAWALTAKIHLPVAAAALVGIAAAAGVGLLMERTLIRRVVDSTPLSALACTLGAALTLGYAEAFIWGYNIQTFPSPVGNGSFHLGTVTVTAPRIASFVAAAAVAGGLALFLRRTRLGLAVWAATSDQALARMSGVSVDRVRALVWALGGALSGLAAILLGTIYTFHPLANTLFLVRALAAALLGGLTSLPGAFVGGISLGVLEALVVWRTGVGGAVDTAIVVLMIAVLLVRPGGLLSERSR